MITELTLAKPNPQNKTIKINLKDENQEQIELILASEVVHHLLAAFLSKKILPDFYNGTETYPIPLASIGSVVLDDGQAVLRLFFPSGFPITVEFTNGHEDIDKMIASLQNLKDITPPNETTTH